MSNNSSSTDRFDVSRSARASAAVEWRTIPPTINVRYKRRPPPLSLLTRRPSDVSLVSPGPADSSTMASPFSPYPSSLSATSTRRSSSQWPWSATLSTFSEADGKIDHLTTGPILSQAGGVKIGAPVDPIRYLIDHPWDFTEYLHLLSIVQALQPSELDDWTNVAILYNSTSLGHPHRIVWDCWHRWTVSWFSGGTERPSDAATYPDVLGVQHSYRYVNVELLVDLYLTVTKTLGTAEFTDLPNSKTEEFDPVPPTPIPRRHPLYPSPPDPPNVPKRTLGDVAHRGILPWFRATAINTTVLQIQAVVSRSSHDGDEAGLRRGLKRVAGDEPPIRLPIHLYRMRVPPRVRGEAG